MNLESDELINLINDESLKTKLDKEQVYKCFCKCLIKTIIDIHNKFKLLENFDIDNSFILGTNMFYNIFWMLIMHTNNIKLTIFFSVWAVLLFTEFVIMSREAHLDKEIYFNPTLIDAVTFAYKKTIGPIKLNNVNNNPNINNIIKIKNASKIINIIMQEHSKILFSLNNDPSILEEINLNIYTSVYKLFISVNDNNLINIIFDSVININNKNTNNYLNNILFLKLLFTLMHEKPDKINLIKYSHDFYYDLFDTYLIKQKITIKIDHIKNIKKNKIYNIIKNMI